MSTPTPAKMSPTGTFHLVFSLLAILFGAVVIMLPKGTRWHRTWGHGYVWSMVGVMATSFAMFDLTGSVTPFHVAAVVGGVTIGGGMWTVLRRRPKKHWIHAHATWMAWSYVGLMAAFVSESMTRFVMPAVQGTLEHQRLWFLFWGLVGVGTFVTVGVGAWLIRRNLDDAVQATPHAMRAEREELASPELTRSGT